MNTSESETPVIPTALAQFDALPDSAYVRLPVVAGLLGIGPATVWRWVRARRLPKPAKLSPGVTAWRVGDLRTHAVRETGASGERTRLREPFKNTKWTTADRHAAAVGKRG